MKLPKTVTEALTYLQNDTTVETVVIHPDSLAEAHCWIGIEGRSGTEIKVENDRTVLYFVR